MPPAPKPAAVLPCVHRGEATPETVGCQTCAGKVDLKVFGCAGHPEGCTLTKKVPGRACCKGCKDNPAKGDSLTGQFNPSLFEHGGRFWLASRKGWTGSRIYLTPLGADLARAG